MTTANNVDYANVYFKYKIPTPINGEPSNKSLKRLKTELRANGSSVDTDLGGGDHGYLGLVLSDPEYARIQPTPTPFVAPNFPGALILDPALTAVQQVQERETQKEQVALYRECKNVEKALLRHIQTALEEKYLEAMVDDDTGLIEDDIPTVLDYLFTTYGKVTAEEVKNKEAEVLSITFNPADPLVTIYRPIDQLQKKATEAGIPYTPEQILEFGLALIRNTRDFEKALGDWNTKTGAKTWDEFKAHFRKAQTELKEIRGPTMQQAGYHHANMLAQQLQVNLENQQREMLAMVQNMVPEAQEHIANTQHVEQQTANAVVTTVQQQMLEILQNMQAAQLANNNPNNANNGDGGGGQPRRRRNRRTPDNATFNRQDTTQYCHSHGGCNHSSANCNRQAPGHRSNATLANRMGGSNAFCNQDNNE